MINQISKNLKILTVENKKEEKFLRTKTIEFDFSKFNKKETAALVKQMKEAMNAAAGIGLSANQIGLNLKVFTVQMPASKEIPAKFYAVFNPEITKSSVKKTVMEEGCLSVPGMYGIVERPEKITLEGRDKNGKKLKIKSWGLLARVFQHECDHLNGILFIDKAREIHKAENIDYNL